MYTFIWILDTINRSTLNTSEIHTKKLLGTSNLNKFKNI